MWHRIRIRVSKIGYIIIGLPLSYAGKWAGLKTVLCVLLLSIISVALILGFERLTVLTIVFIARMFVAFRG